MSREFGRVAGLWRYPVKSMGEERLTEVDIAWHGLSGDRRWAFVRGGVARSGFPWLTIRERPDMGRYRPSALEPEHPDRSPTVVRTPRGDQYDVTDPALAAELGDGVRVIKQDRGVFDAMPLSLITTRSIASLEALVGLPLAVQRFRPNLLIDAAGVEPFPEDGWVGRTLTVGDLQMRVDARDQRCAVINIDPETAESDPRVLRAIPGERQARLGVYGQVVRPGRVSVGDPVLADW